MWLKGNLHTHSTESDGELHPDEVVDWYRSRGYDFLAITDHNRLTDLRRIHHRSLALIPAIELHTAPLGSPEIPIHLNAYGVSKAIVPKPGANISDTLQTMVDLIRDAGGVAQINHPNWGFAFDHTHMLPVRGWKFLEIYNGHPDSYNLGDENHPSVELMWDELLAAGHKVFGVAVDDAHRYHEFSPQRANPGRGWVIVRAEKKRAGSILAALERGDFYASTGPTLRIIETGNGRLTIEVEPVPGVSYSMEVFGGPGILLAKETGRAAEFQISDFARRARGYIRAKVSASDGSAAWTQPFFVES